MSATKSRYDGEQAMLPEKRTRYRRPELIKLRSAQMYAQKLAGWTTVEVGVYFHMSPQMVNRHIADIPEYVRQRIARGYRRGEILVA